MGRFERKLDLDLIERIRNGWKPHNNPEPLKQQKPPRPGNTYRATRRNALKRKRAA